MNDNSINTIVSENDLTNTVRLSSRYVRGRAMDVDEQVFKNEPEDIKKFNESLLIKDIRKEVDKDLIETYSKRFEAVLNNTELYLNDLPMDSQVRLKLEQIIMNLLFEIGFSARLVNDIQQNLNR